MPLIERFIQFTTKYRFLTHCCYWFCVYILWLFRYNAIPDPHYTLMQESVNSIFFIAFAAITSYFLAYIILPRLLHKGKTVQTVVIMVLGLYVINVFSRISVVYLLEPLIRTRPFEQESIWEIVTDIDYLFMVYFVHAFSYAFIFVFIKLLKDQYVINKRALNLEKQKADIELMALKSQLNPHFLFNTLNNIYSLSIMQSPQTSPAIARLSEILDTLLYRSSNLFVPISQEIQLLNNYIELEKLRYDDRLEISLDIQVERDVHIAPLILLSLVENSFKHGAGEDAGSPKIHIQLLLQNHLLSFVVSNTFQSKVDQQIGIGLDNISKQLNLLYPETHTFETVVAQQTFTAKLNLVLNNNT